jgi:hypothetical protein
VANDDGLKHAALGDVLRQLGDLFFGKLGPWVAWILLRAVDRYEEGQSVSTFACWL